MSQLTECHPISDADQYTICHSSLYALPTALTFCITVTNVHNTTHTVGIQQ